MNFKLQQRNLNEILKDLNLEDNGRVQKYLDKRTAERLKPYVSFKTGTQEAQTQSLKAGTVTINVKYAGYQAYSPRIKKRVGKRGTRPFERMKEAEKHNILTEVTNYAKSISK